MWQEVLRGEGPGKVSASRQQKCIAISEYGRPIRSLATLRVSHKQAGSSNGLKTRVRWDEAREQLRAGEMNAAACRPWSQQEATSRGSRVGGATLFLL